MNKLLLGALLGGAFLGAALATQRRRRPLDGRPPANWWRTASPTGRGGCYATKSKTLRAFLDTNYQLVENYGGADYRVSPSEFDAINHKYGLVGKNAARTIADAVWAAMPERKPYCLDRIDIDTLNDTSPARESDVPFQLPDDVHEGQIAAEEARYYANQGLGAPRKRRTPAPMKVGDRVTSETGMPGTVLALRFGRLGEGAENVWIANVQWHGKYPSVSRYLAKRLRVLS